MKLRYPVVAVAAGLLVAPYFTGKIVEQEFNSIYEQMSASMPYQIKVDNYQRGWFSSTADVSVTIEQDIPDMVQPLTMTFVAKHDIQHGPILTQSSIALGLADIANSFDFEHNMPENADITHDFSKDKIHYSTQISFTGGMNSVMETEQINVTTPDATIAILPLQLQADLSRDGALVFDGNWLGMTVTAADVEVLRLGKMDLVGDQQVVRGDIFANTAVMVGDTKVNLAKMNFIDEVTGQSVNISDIEIISNSQDKEGMMYADAKMTAKTIDAMGVKLSDFNYTASINKVDLDVYAELQKLLVSGSSTEDPARFAMEVQALIPKFFESSPEIKINNLGVKTEQGDIASKMDITIDESKVDANNPMSLIMALDAKADGSAPIEFFEQLGMGENIEALIMQNMLVQDQEKVKFDFSFNNGQALINGMPMPLG
ncbi:DUF945 domain-containing protein [Thalassotalea sp. HSM 43]|uniref:DUF945 family protein n=1 Tax=Thalassotalea sp. HSM 43 TaxID=2552945 RepID=UPI0010807E32|nr:DUF945 family protein [Thalassotalea sp. HSM 43]QBY04492.1 DUF945 domain-containing protein [Thalassotalea sp. HSM 43]